MKSVSRALALCFGLTALIIAAGPTAARGMTPMPADLLGGKYG